MMEARYNHFGFAGQVIGISTGRQLDVDDVVCFYSGRLLLSLTKDSYQRFGLDGKKFVQDKFVIELDVGASGFLPGQPLFERVRSCLERLALVVDLIVQLPKDVDFGLLKEKGLCVCVLVGIRTVDFIGTMTNVTVTELQSDFQIVSDLMVPQLNWYKLTDADDWKFVKEGVQTYALEIYEYLGLVANRCWTLYVTRVLFFNSSHCPICFASFYPD